MDLGRKALKGKGFRVSELGCRCQVLAVKTLGP